MSVRLCFFLFLVKFVICEKKTEVVIDSATLQDVFGSPPQVNSVESQSSYAYSQAVPVTAVEEEEEVLTVVPLPQEKFIQSSADYDQFDWILTKRIAASSDENFLLSPLGLKLALALLTEAATGSTRSELASVLGNSLNKTAVRNKYSTIMESLQAPSSDYILNLGSRIYLDEGLTPQQRFAAVAEEFYRTELVNVDFTNPLTACVAINSWVANVTAGRISALVDEEDLTGIVAMILTTLYYKGNWTDQFPVSATKPGPFFASPKESYEVPFMNVKSKFYYSESTAYDAKILRLPYLGNKFSMYIIVPNSLTGLPRVMNALSVRNIRTEIQFIKEQLVDVTLPKFRFDYTSVLNHVLKELGIRQAFQDTASFPGLARGQGLRHLLKISRVLQRSGIEVNEVGSIAYSATEITLVNKFGNEDDITEEVVANKPFLFFIQDDATRQLLFTGRVSNPAKVDGAFKLD